MAAPYDGLEGGALHALGVQAEIVKCLKIQ
jgi:hypothetical protein